jgi:hypothetical protein
VIFKRVASDLSISKLFPKDFLDLLFQNRNFLSRCHPGNIPVNGEVFMNCNIAKADKIHPRNIGEKACKFFWQAGSGLSNHGQFLENRSVHHFVLFEFIEILTHHESFDGSSSFHNVSQV